MRHGHGYGSGEERMSLSVLKIHPVQYILYLFILFCRKENIKKRIYVYCSRKFPKPESDGLEPVQNSTPGSEREGVVL